MAKDPKKNEENAINSTSELPIVGSSTIPVTKPGKKVEIDETLLEELVKGMSSMKEEMEILRKAADKGRLERIESSRSQGKLIKQVKLSSVDDKFVVGWKRLTDEVFFDEAGRLHEDQKIEIFFTDGTTKQLSDREFARRKSLIPGEIIKESKDMDGNINLTVQFKDGKEIEIDQIFVN